MAKKLNILGIEGKVGDVTIYERRGAQVSRPATNPARKVRTEGTMRQRTRLSNNNAAWRVLRRGIKGLFDKEEGQTDLHRFLSLNGKQARVYLTQQEAAAGCCVVDNFAVSQGSLPSVQVRDGGEYWVSDLRIKGNKRLRTGDTIHFLRLTQVLRDGLPFAELFVDRQTVTYEYADLPFAELLADELTENYDFTVNHDDGFLNIDDYLACKKQKDSLIAWVITRRGHGLRVSSQRLIGENSLLAQYTGDDALARAMASYGEAKNPHPSHPSQNSQPSQPDLEARLDRISQQLDRIISLLEKRP